MVSGEEPDGQPPAPAPPEIKLETGDAVEVTLTLRADREFEHLMVEDMLPAGCEAQSRGRVRQYDWSYWWADQIVRDDRVSFAVTELHPGVKRVTYRMVAQIPGTYTALPPRVFDMYDPTVRTEGVATGVTVGR